MVAPIAKAPRQSLCRKQERALLRRKLSAPRNVLYQHHASCRHASADGTACLRCRDVFLLRAPYGDIWDLRVAMPCVWRKIVHQLTSVGFAV